MDTDLIVLGAGPAGLGAAHRAAARGHRATVIERLPTVGGAARSFKVGGQRVDLGSHRLHPSTAPEILAELRRLLGDDLQLRRRNGRIRLDGRWIAFPLRLGDAVRSLPPSFALAAARDAATAWARRPRDDTFAEVLRAGLGPAMCERFYFPYARKLWGLDPARVSSVQARKRVGAGSASAVLRRLLRPGEGQRDSFYYPRRGFGQLWERLAEALVEAGGDLRLSTTATELRLGEDGVAVATDDGTTVTGGRVWSTIPLPVLVRLADPEPPEEVRAAAGTLRTRAMALVYLVLDHDRYTPFDAHYLPQASTPVSRLSEPKNYRDGDDPPGRTVLCAEIPCDRGDALWSADTEALVEVVVETLRGVALPEPRVADAEVIRIPDVYPVYEVGFEDALARLDAWAAAQPRLLTFGRQGLFVHDNSHHALAMGWAAADALRADGGFDDAAWARARARFEDHVVED